MFDFDATKQALLSEAKAKEDAQAEAMKLRIATAEDLESSLRSYLLSVSPRSSVARNLHQVRATIGTKELNIDVHSESLFSLRAIQHHPPGPLKLTSKTTAEQLMIDIIGVVG